jgi:hypothetical protein
MGWFWRLYSHLHDLGVDEVMDLLDGLWATMSALTLTLLGSHLASLGLAAGF